MTNLGAEYAPSQALITIVWFHRHAPPESNSSVTSIRVTALVRRQRSNRKLPITKNQRNRFWHIIYGANLWQTYRAIELVKQRNAGYIYITNDRFTNLYDTLPLYFTQELGKLPADCPAN
ncbi:MAG: hypothetical protein ACR2F2_13525 [Pyrinomonadaceae bacterium]